MGPGPRPATGRGFQGAGPGAPCHRSGARCLSEVEFSLVLGYSEGGEGSPQLQGQDAAEPSGGTQAGQGFPVGERPWIFRPES